MSNYNLKKLARRIVSAMLAFEGVMHFVVPSISLFGMYKAGVWDWMIALTPISDILFGVVCLIGSYLLGVKHHH